MKISAMQYSKLLYEMTEGKSEREIDFVIANFIRFLRKNRQIKLISKIIARFNEIWNKKNGVIEVETITLNELKNSQTYQIKNFLEKKYLVKKIVFNKKINEKIKGGIIMKIGDEILDISLAKQLRELKKALMK